MKTFACTYMAYNIGLSTGKETHSRTAFACGVLVGGYVTVKGFVYNLPTVKNQIGTLPLCDFCKNQLLCISIKSGQLTQESVGGILDEVV
jgi:hypothetical protein